MLLVDLLINTPIQWDKWSHQMHPLFLFLSFFLLFSLSGIFWSYYWTIRVIKLTGTSHMGLAFHTFDCNGKHIPWYFCPIQKKRYTCLRYTGQFHINCQHIVYVLLSVNPATPLALGLSTWRMDSPQSMGISSMYCHSSRLCRCVCYRTKLCASIIIHSVCIIFFCYGLTHFYVVGNPPLLSHGVKGLTSV